MRSGALRIALIYIAVALAWIALSDRILFLFHDDLEPDVYAFINSAKGIVFVLITGALLRKLILLDEEKLLETNKKCNAYDDEIKRLGKIITKVNNMIVITDQNNFITWVNKAFEDFTGYSMDDVVGYSPATFFAGEETDLEVLGSIISRKKEFKSFSVDIKCHKKCGKKFWVYGEFTPLFNDKNESTGYIAVYNDITWLKEKEQEIIQQNEKLKEVAWLSSHEIRRPLANIIGLANLIKISPYPEEKIKILENVNKSAEELDQIVHSINSRIGDDIQNMHDSE